MTRLRTVELTCPVCRTLFRSQTVVSTTTSGGKRTDFYEPASGAQLLPFLVHMCHRCGYSAAERDFTDEVEVTATLCEHVWNELAPGIGVATITGSEKYEAAAKVAEWQGVEPRQVGDLWLRAAWCCVSEEDTEAERFYHRKAAWTFERALDNWDGVAREERAILTYLVGEIWRRVGNVKVARKWFDRVAAEIVDATLQWVLEAARQQRDCPREWFA
jgi:uncharacterized protein (DUF2225 family)